MIDTIWFAFVALWILANCIAFALALLSALTAVFETISGTLNTAAGGYGSTNEEYDLSKGFQSVMPQMTNALAGVLNVSSEMKGSQRASTMPFKSDNISPHNF